MYELAVNQSLELKPGENRQNIDYSQLFPKAQPWFEKLSALKGLEYQHQENRFIDFNQQKLIPYKISDRGPAVAVNDLDGNGSDDVFLEEPNLREQRFFSRLKEVLSINNQRPLLLIHCGKMSLQ